MFVLVTCSQPFMPWTCLDKISVSIISYNPYIYIKEFVSSKSSLPYQLSLLLKWWFTVPRISSTIMFIDKETLSYIVIFFKWRHSPSNNSKFTLRCQERNHTQFWEDHVIRSLKKNEATGPTSNVIIMCVCKRYTSMNYSLEKELLWPHNYLRWVCIG